MNMPALLGLRADVWAQHPEGRLSSLQDLENGLAGQEGRTACTVDAKLLDPQTRGVHYSQEGAEHIDLNTTLVDAPEPYQAVETLFHESRHSYQDHVVRNPELSEDPEMLRNWQMSAGGGYIQPWETLDFADYRFQPMEVDARETARARTDELYEGVFQDEAGYPEHKAQKEEELHNDVEAARREYQIDPTLGEEEALDEIKSEARQAMVDEYQSVNQEAEEVRDMVPESPDSRPGDEVSREDVSEIAGEAVSAASGVPATSEVNQEAGETAEKVQSAAEESVGQSTNVPTESAAEDASQQDQGSDEEQYYGYGY